MKERFPLGFIELDSGLKPVYALYDFFLNFTFEKKENWEDLRLMVNILLDAYMKQNPETIVIEPPTKVCAANFCHPLRKGDCDTTLYE